MAAADDPSPDLAAGFSLAAYVLTGRVLGRGGFGTVYEARHTQLDRLVAIKVQNEATANARFLEEARLIARLRHPNIVDIFDVGALEDGRVYFVMELLEGVTLERHLAEHGRLAIGVALPILRELARALDAIHAKSFAHRDVKPSNVMLVRDDDGSLRVKLLDFGIAKALDAGHTGTAVTAPGMLVGTPEYMSPEQCLVDPVGPASDIYSLGVITYRVLTGQRLFSGHAVDVLHAHVHSSPPPPSRAGTAPALDAPILAMLAKSPDARPRSATAAIEALAAPIPAAAEDPTMRARAPAARSRRPMVILLGIAALAGAAVVAVLAWPHDEPRSSPPPSPPAPAVAPDAAVTVTTPDDAAVPTNPSPIPRKPTVKRKSTKDDLEDLPAKYRAP